MLIDYWPLLGLRLTTPRLELRLPRSDELAALADLARDGVHDPSQMPFSSGWTDLPGTERARSVVQHHWLRLGNWKPDDWSLNLAVFLGGRPVGIQAMAARRFTPAREVNTASWLGLSHQSQGIGTEMRAAVLHLAFAGLGAEEATTGAFADNAPSLAVSRKLGYVPDGIERRVVRGEVVIMQRLRLPRDLWRPALAKDTEIIGLLPCLQLFGLATDDDTGPAA
ncbi:GNAT family N-acetyltransferase [Streptomyces venezuelae]|uniref:GNAT family N-acetyltransferase n=1 Tax=Streptomyces venezuelae TaxID=54571 RepID=UPI0033250C53